MGFAAYSSRTERAARAYIAKKAAEQRAIEEANKPVQIETQPERELSAVELLALEAVRQFEETGTVSGEIRTHNIPVREIIKAVCRGTYFTPKDIIGRGRSYPVRDARQKAMCIAALAKRQSLILLGREFKRDHTTILSALEKHGIEREPIRKKRELTDDDIFAIHEMRNQGMGRHKIASLMRMGTARLDEVLSGKVGVTIKSRVVELFEQGHDTYDIAQIMGLTEPQVCDRLHQARERARYNRTKRAA
ncbi:helix-turn-helix domain-containing protein [Brucella intermedia]|uniref:helix-turn-helix domain-containing protein n=1 Tax=Brucella intermedia TaxID=94625 RepID=UPI00200027B6|nr:helix-turn-helix domain-containing protein [Brucella intermedia]